jgi:mRNA interferase MazF
MFVRGSVVWAEFGQAVGSESSKRRPAIVVSNNGANLSAWQGGQGVVTIVPLTSASRRRYNFQVSIPAAQSGLTKDSIAQAEQVRSVDVRRIAPTSAVLGESLMGEISRALKLHLGLW